MYDIGMLPRPTLVSEPGVLGVVQNVVSFAVDFKAEAIANREPLEGCRIEVVDGAEVSKDALPPVGKVPPPPG